MRRNKIVKRASKRQMTPVHQMEKEIFTIPAKLVAQLNKEISALKQKENKIKNAFNKINAQIKKSAVRVKTADKLKHTSAGKKQLNKAKKSHNEIVKSQAAYNKNLQEIMHSLENSENKQSKLIALGKHLNQFEKDWAKNSKQMKASAAKSKPKKTVAKAKKIVPTMDRPHAEPYEATLDHIRHDETADVAS